VLHCSPFGKMMFVESLTSLLIASLAALLKVPPLVSSNTGSSESGGVTLPMQVGCPY